MSNRLIVGVIGLLVIIVLVAMLVVLIGIYQQNTKLVPTDDPNVTPTLNAATQTKAAVIISCVVIYPDEPKQTQCIEAGGFVAGKSTPIP